MSLHYLGSLAPSTYAVFIPATFSHFRKECFALLDTRVQFPFDRGRSSRYISGAIYTTVLSVTTPRSSCFVSTRWFFCRLYSPATFSRPPIVCRSERGCTCGRGCRALCTTSALVVFVVGPRCVHLRPSTHLTRTCLKRVRCAVRP